MCGATCGVTALHQEKQQQLGHHNEVGMCWLRHVMAEHRALPCCKTTEDHYRGPVQGFISVLVRKVRISLVKIVLSFGLYADMLLLLLLLL